MAKRSGLSTRTIDYYTQMGLLSYSRSDGNYRLYNEEVFEQLVRIQQLKDQRFSLQEIKEMLSGPAHPVSTETLEEVNHDLAALQEKLVSLQKELASAPPEQKRYISQEIHLRMVPILQMMTTLLS